MADLVIQDQRHRHRRHLDRDRRLLPGLYWCSADLSPGDVLGHEVMGIVQEVGAGMTNLVPATVVILFNIDVMPDVRDVRAVRDDRGPRAGRCAVRYTSLYGRRRWPGPVPAGAAGAAAWSGRWNGWDVDVRRRAADRLAGGGRCWTPKDGTLAVLGLVDGSSACIVSTGVERVIGRSGSERGAVAAGSAGDRRPGPVRQSTPVALLIDRTGRLGPDAIIDVHSA